VVYVASATHVKAIWSLDDEELSSFLLT